MKCEHAQEFFSEYIEQALDKPSWVALEAHLTACAACRHGLEGLQQTWGALNAVPMVEPPKDLAWKVMVQLQQERLERLEAQRRRRNPFAAWLQSLTPGAAFGYAVLTALLLVAVAFPLHLSGGIGTVFGLFGDKPSSEIVAPVDPQPSAEQPEVGFAGAFQDAKNGLWFYRLFVTPPPSLRNSVVRVNPTITISGQPFRTREHRQPLKPGEANLILVPVTVPEGPVQGVFVHVEAPGRTLTPLYLKVPGLGSRADR